MRVSSTCTRGAGSFTQPKKTAASPLQRASPSRAKKDEWNKMSRVLFGKVTSRKFTVSERLTRESSGGGFTAREISLFKLAPRKISPSGYFCPGTNSQQSVKSFAL